MSTNPQDQEIDLGQLSKKIGSFFQSLIDSFFDFILFLKRNIILVAILFILGIVLGYFLDKETKSYKSEIVVIPNFGSVDDLYSKINLISSKINENDTVFLKSIGINDSKIINDIEIEPVIDVYQFIQYKESNFELIKLMAEDGNLEQIIKEKTTSKNYPYHLIRISTNNKTSLEKVVNPLLAFLNNSDYFSTVKKESLSSLKIEMEANEQTIKQIDGILNEFSNVSSNNNKNDKLVYYNENNQLDEVINSKAQLIQKQSNNKITLINYQKIVKDISTNLNIKNTKGTNGKMKFLLPFFFVLMYMLIIYFRKVFKKQLEKRNLNS